MFASKDVFLTPPSGGYTIARSVRLRSSASAYFNRTTTTPTSGSIFTHSFWVKRGILGSLQTLISGARPTNFDRIYISATDTLLYQWNDGTSNLVYLETTQVFRDPSAWYHIIVATDTTQATSTNRVKIYVNGTQVTALTSTTYPTQNSTSYLNVNAGTLNLGRTSTAVQYLDGYLTEINFIDGQALTPSSFGTTNAITGVWQPAKYTGTYGTNGFYLNFSDNSSNTASTIGKDYSGNGNNWTPNNISVTAGVTYDSMTDVPTLTSATAANYAVLNPLVSSSYQNITQGNLATFSNTTTDSGIAVATMGSSTGKFYWEVTVSGGSSGYPITGALRNIPASGNGTVPGSSTLGGFSYYTNLGYVLREGSNITTVATSTTNDIIGFALDIDNLQVAIYKNNTLLYTLTGLTAGTYFPATATYASTGVYQNFGQRPFSYTPPTGFVALNTYNLPASTITNGAAYMAATLYNGTGAAQNIYNTVNGVSFQPDLVWYKSRNITENHQLFDSVRGVQKSLYANLTNAETIDPGVYTFNTNGFNSYNANGYTYVGWQWKAGGTAVSNTAGSITSSVSANTTAGFSVVTYTGTGANATVGHGLGVAPSMIISKKRSAVAAWVIGFTYSGFTWSTDYFQFDTSAKHTDGAGTVFTAAPTSTVFSLGTDAGENGSGATFVAYCFAAVAGYSAFGSYTGNGSTDGTFVYTGFRPRFVLIKITNTTSSWFLFDSSRSTYNSVLNYLLPNDSGAAGDLSQGLDFLSNGFKLRDVGNGLNGSGNTYIYAAFAENPFRNALAR